MIPVRLVATAAEQAALAAPLLAAAPVVHTVLATSLERAQRVPASAEGALWWVAERGGEVVAAGQHWPPYPVSLQGLAPEVAGEVVPGVVQLVAAEVAVAHAAPRGVVGAEAAARLFARAWTSRSGGTAEVHRVVRLHELDVLVAPRDVVGRPRPAGPADASLVAAWSAAFLEDIGEPAVDPGLAARLRSDPATLLWEVDGRPVSLAAARPAVAGVSRVGPVYTPPGERRRGYGGAVTAAAVRLALDGGATSVCLFTDLANPTSNAVYARLGFRPVHDELELAFR